MCFAYAAVLVVLVNTMCLLTRKKCVSLLRVFYSYAANCVTNPYERVVRIEITVATVTEI